jgi:uncharacterized membrane protein
VSVAWLLVPVGLVFAYGAYASFRDRANPRRRTTGLFWGLLAFAFLAGDHVPPVAMGVVALALALIAGFGGVGRAARADDDAEARRASAARHGHALFLPALAIPVVTVIALTIANNYVVDTNLALYCLLLACVVALAGACALTRRSPRRALDASSHLLDAVGWALVLPLMLATLGVVFTEAKVGDLVAAGVAQVIPVDSALACVAAYALGMALFTIIMGNAFAAFPVITAGIGLPLLVARHGADPAAMAAIGMLSGYCGTLMTPMAANFNIVPAALLELSDPNAVIKAQVPTALVLLAANVGLMYFIVFR